MDPIHTVYLHTLVGETQFEETWGITPVLKFHDGETGLYSTLTYRVDDMIWVRTQQTVFPTFSHVGAFWETGKEKNISLVPVLPNGPYQSMTLTV